GTGVGGVAHSFTGGLSNGLGIAVACCGNGVFLLLAADGTSPGFHPRLSTASLLLRFPRRPAVGEGRRILIPATVAADRTQVLGISLAAAGRCYHRITETVPQGERFTVPVAVAADSA